MPEPTFYTYDQWILLNPDLLSAEREDRRQCHSCNGTGIYTCPVCDSDVNCPDCNGTGYISSVDSKQEYRRQLALDESKWKKYLRENQ
jgi:hypothetical protein